MFMLMVKSYVRVACGFVLLDNLGGSLCAGRLVSIDAGFGEIPIIAGGVAGFGKARILKSIFTLAVGILLRRRGRHMSELLSIGKFTFESLEARRMLSISGIAVPRLVDSSLLSPDIAIDQPDSVQIDWQDSKPYLTTSNTALNDATLSRFNGPLPIDQYSATIDWGDGTSSQGTIARQDSGSFVVLGSHDYGVKNQFDIAITVTGTDGSVGYDYHTIFTQADGMVVTSAPVIYNSTSDTAIDSYVGSFFDANPSAASAYTVSIDWGDGTTSAGQVTQADDGSFDINADHGYSSAGDYNISFTVSKGAQTLTALGTAQIWADDPTDQPDPGWIDLNDSSTYLGTPGTSVTNQVLATFNGALPADQYSAMIDWGDGTSSDGLIVRQSDGSFAVVGSHDYADKGAFDVSIEVDASDGSSGYDYRRVLTQADALVLTSAPLVWTYDSLTSQELTVASFYDQDPSADTSAYVITIDWGDGTSSAGQALAACDGSFDVVGNHAYTTPGTFTISIAMSKGGESLTASGTANVADATKAPDWPIYWADRAVDLVADTGAIGGSNVVVIDPTPPATALPAPAATTQRSSAGTSSLASDIFQTHKKIDDAMIGGELALVLS
jgi:hypothetical protein